MLISYTIADSTFGRLLVAGTARGLCFVSLGDVDALLEKELWSDYPAADIIRDDAPLALWTRALLKYLDGDPAALDLPLDVEGTSFQQRVWNYLRSIPYGSTSTYGEIARKARLRGERCSCRRPSLRHQPCLFSDSVPPRSARRRRAGRLSLGPRPQSSLACSRAAGRSTQPRALIYPFRLQKDSFRTKVSVWAFGEIKPA
jgi:hypothetical protein